MPQFENHNAAIFGVSFDSVADNRAFAEKFSFPYDLLCDSDHSIGEAYGAYDPSKPQHARRISYLIDAEGVIQAAFPRAKPATHAADLLAALER